jgi:cell division protein FtsA
MTNPIITGIDLGTSTIKVLVARKSNENSDFEVLAKIERPSFGIRKGVITKIDEISETIQTCIEEAESLTNHKINGVYTNINGSHIFSTISRGLVSVSRADQKISSEDIDRVIQAAKAFPLPKNKEILDVSPREYIIDGVGGIKNPLDMQGIRFEVEALIVGGFSPYKKNVVQAVLESGVELDDLFFSQSASARAVLSSREKELGVAVLDIGAGTSSITIFEEDTLVYTAVFPIGSNDITNDIAIGLRTDIDTAEKIKLEFGSCIAGKQDKKKEKIKSLESEEELVFSRFFLRKIIEARVCEIIDLAKEEIKKISKLEKLPSGIVITGGGAKITKIVDLTKKSMKLPCRIGEPLNFNPPFNDPSFATVCGLIMLGNDSEDHNDSNSMMPKLIKKIKNIFKSINP